jgi:CheY-like chemotaxis protein
MRRSLESNVFLAGFLFALLSPILGIVVLAVAFAYGEAGVASLTAALLGYGVLTDWHVRRRQARASVPLPIDTAKPQRLFRWIPARGHIDVSVIGRLQWSLPTMDDARRSRSSRLLQGGIALRARSTTGFGAEREMPTDTQSRVTHRPGAPTASHGARIVVLAGDAEFQGLLADVLHSAGHAAVACRDGDTAFQLVSDEQPDLVILDLDMVGPKSALSVLDLLVLGPATTHIPMVVTTLDLKSVDHAREWLGDHHVFILPRPFDPTDLSLAVNAALGRAEADVPPSHWISSYRWNT